MDRCTVAAEVCAGRGVIVSVHEWVGGGWESCKW